MLKKEVQMVVKTDLNHAREMYEKIKHHEPFKKVAARFNVNDLEYLLEGSDPLKLTYIYNEVTLPKGEELRRWVEGRVLAHLASRAVEGGYTFDTLEETLKLAASIDSKISRDAWLEQLIRTPTSIEYLRKCLAAGLSGIWIRAGLSSGASVELLQELKAKGVPSRYAGCAVQMTRIGGLDDCGGVQCWYHSGVSPQAATAFIEARCWR
jgi:hypothetical protein